MKLENLFKKVKMMNNALQEEILKLKEEKNAIILAHNYQPKEVQEIADFLGDSLELCIKASEIEDKDLVIFCGVDFMAETAFILNPDKKIVIPTLEAECPMAQAKQHADTLCTSANAVKVTESLPHKKILFGPDKNLGTHVADKLKDKEIIHVPSDGHCYVHRLIHVEDVELKRKEYPNAEIICHPECKLEDQKACDVVMSTGGMLRHIAESDKEEFVIGTEIDMITRINAEVPGKKLYPLLEGAICNTMKLHTLEKIRDSLINEEPRVTLPSEVADKSRKAVEHMLEVSK